MARPPSSTEVRREVLGPRRAGADACSRAPGCCGDEFLLEVFPTAVLP